MPGLWKNKYLVTRRDGSKPEWPLFVMGARDPAAIVALHAYADEAERQGYDPDYVRDVRSMTADFTIYLAEHGPGDPTAPPHRPDDPETIAQLGEHLQIIRDGKVVFDSHAPTSEGDPE